MPSAAVMPIKLPRFDIEVEPGLAPSEGGAFVRVSDLVAAVRRMRAAHRLTPETTARILKDLGLV